MNKQYASTHKPLQPVSAQGQANPTNNENPPSVLAVTADIRTSDECIASTHHALCQAVSRLLFCYLPVDGLELAGLLSTQDQLGILSRLTEQWQDQNANDLHAMIVECSTALAIADTVIFKCLSGIPQDVNTMGSVLEQLEHAYANFSAPVVQEEAQIYLDSERTTDPWAPIGGL